MTSATSIPVPSNPVLDRLRSAVLNSDCPLLYREVIGATYFTRDLRPAAEAAFGLGIPSKTAYVDVPLSSIQALGRENDFWWPGDCWRDLVLERLEASDWTMDCIDYLENPIGDKEFPPPTARGVLELACFGGVTYCDNGNHRLAAAYCWLAATKGAHASLQKVKTSMTLLDRRKIRVVLSLAHEESAEIAIFTPDALQVMNYGRNTFVRILTRDRCTYYRLAERPELLHAEGHSAGSAVLESLLSFFSDRHRNLVDGFQGMQWVVMPRDVLETWASSSWLEQAFTPAAPAA